MALDCKLVLPKPVAGGSQPAWMDPRAIMAQCAARVTTIDAPVAGLILLLAPADPKRVSITFGPGSFNSTWVGPTEAPLDKGWFIDSAAKPRDFTFSIFDYGPLVNLAWYGHFLGVQSLTVYESYRLF